MGIQAIHKVEGESRPATICVYRADCCCAVNFLYPSESILTVLLIGTLEPKGRKKFSLLCVWFAAQRKRPRDTSQVACKAIGRERAARNTRFGFRLFFSHIFRKIFFTGQEPGSSLVFCRFSNFQKRPRGLTYTARSHVYSGYRAVRSTVTARLDKI